MVGLQLPYDRIDAGGPFADQNIEPCVPPIPRLQWRDKNGKFCAMRPAGKYRKISHSRLAAGVEKSIGNLIYPLCNFATVG